MPELGTEKRLWDLSSGVITTNIYDGVPIEVHGTLWSVPFTCATHVKRNGRTLEHAFLDTPTGKYARGAMQQIMATVTEGAARARGKLSSDIACAREPVRVLLEVVRAEPPAAAADDDAGALPRFSASAHGHARARAADLRDDAALRALPGGAPSVYASNVATRAFMRDVADVVEVAGYRLWVVAQVPHSCVDFGALLLRALGDNERAYAKWAASSAAEGRYGATLGAGEQHRLLRHIDLWARTVDSLLGDVYLTRPDVLPKARALSRRGAENPAYPDFLFAPEFVVPRAPAGACVAQRDVAAYLGAAGRQPRVDGGDAPVALLRMAVRDHVVEVPACDQYMVRMRAYFMPDYQVRNSTSFCRDDDDADAGDAAPAAAAASDGDGAAALAAPLAACRIGDDVLALRAPAAPAAGDGALVAPAAAGDGVVAPAAGGDGVVAPAAAAAAAPAYMGDAWRAAFGDALGAVARAPVVAASPAAERARVASAAALAREAFESADSLAASESLDATSALRSPLHALRYEGEAMARAAEARGGAWTRVERRYVREEARRRLLASYVQRCLAPSAGISVASDHLNAWFATRTREGRTVFFRAAPACAVFDRRLTIFGHLVAGLFLAFESPLFVSSGHDKMFVTLLAGLDAYSKHKSLHINPAFVGPPGVSKTFYITRLQALFVRGTVTWLSGVTEQAFTGNDDWFDAVVLWDEVPVAVFKYVATSRGPNFESTMKALLTSCETSKRYLVHDADAAKAPGGAALRRAHMSHSCITGTWLFTANFQPNDMSPAMRERVVCMPVDARVRRGRAPEDMVDLEKRLGPREAAQLREFTEFVREHQYMALALENAVYIRALSEVTTAAFDMLRSLYVRLLRDRYQVVVKLRRTVQMQRMVRKLVMMTAVHHVLATPTSEHYGRALALDGALAHMDPLLHDTREQVEFVFRLILGALDTTEASVIGLMRAELAVARTTGTVPPYYTAADARACAAATAEAAAAGSRRRGAVANGNVHVEREYAYISLGGRFTDVARTLATRSAESDTPLSHERVADALRTLEKTSVMSARYMPAPAGDGSVLVDDTQPPVSMPVVFGDAGGTLYVLHEYLTRPPVSPIGEVIAACRAPATVAATYVTSASAHVHAPHLLCTEDVHVDTTREPLVYRNPAIERRFESALLFGTSLDDDADADAESDDEALFDEELVRVADAAAAAGSGRNALAPDERGGLRFDEARGVYVLACSLDEYSARVRARTLFLDEEAAVAYGGACDLRALDDAAQARVRQDVAVRYPDTLLERHLRRRARNLASETRRADAHARRRAEAAAAAHAPALAAAASGGAFAAHAHAKAARLDAATHAAVPTALAGDKRTR